MFHSFEKLGKFKKICRKCTECNKRKLWSTVVKCKECNVVYHKECVAEEHSLDNDTPVNCQLPYLNDKAVKEVEDTVMMDVEDTAIITPPPLIENDKNLACSLIQDQGLLENISNAKSTLTTLTDTHHDVPEAVVELSVNTALVNPISGIPTIPVSGIPAIPVSEIKQGVNETDPEDVTKPSDVVFQSYKSVPGNLTRFNAELRNKNLTDACVPLPVEKTVEYKEDESASESNDQKASSSNVCKNMRAIDATDMDSEEVVQEIHEMDFPDENKQVTETPEEQQPALPLQNVARNKPTVGLPEMGLVELFPEVPETEFSGFFFERNQ